MMRFVLTIASFCYAAAALAQTPHQPPTIALTNEPMIELGFGGRDGKAKKPSLAPSQEVPFTNTAPPQDIPVQAPSMVNPVATRQAAASAEKTPSSAAPEKTHLRNDTQLRSDTPSTHRNQQPENTHSNVTNTTSHRNELPVLPPSGSYPAP